MSHRPFCGPLKPLKLGDTILNFVTETRCFGVTIDSRLTWNSHVESMCKSLGNKVLNQLRIFKYLPRNVLEKIYFTSIVPTVRLGYIFSLFNAGARTHSCKGR